MHPRQELYQQAIEAMAREDFSSAIMTLKTAIADYGPHITVLADLASCYYLMGDYPQFKIKTLAALQEYESIRHRLSVQTRSEVALSLGKLLEELGYLHSAIKLYRSIEEMNDEIYSQQKIRIRAQALRCLSQVSLVEDLAKAYVTCEMQKHSDFVSQVESQHALMLADFRIFGFQQAEQRLRRMLPKLKGYYQRLFVFDYLFELLLVQQPGKFDQSLLTDILYPECDAFEKLVWDLYLRLQNEEVHQEIYPARTEGLSPFGAAKLTYLLLVTSSDIEEKEILKIKLQIYLRSCEQQTRVHLQNIWLREFEQTSIELKNDQLVLPNMKKIALQRQQNLIQILRLFAELQSVQTDSAIRSLYGEEFSDLSFNRLRKAIVRANKFLATELGFTEPLALSKSELRLNQHLKVVIK